MYNKFLFYHYNNMKKIIKKYQILLPIIILNIISLLFLSNTSYFIKQTIFLLISFFTFIIASKININFIKKYSIILYLISILLLTIVLIFGKEINGSKAWLHIFNISIQPSELTKITLILYSATLITNKPNILKLFIIFLIPSILTFLEPDTGAIIFYIIIFLSIIPFIKIPKKYLILFTSSITTVFITFLGIYLTNKRILISIFGSKLWYRLDRLISFKTQNNLQITNSLISIGSHKLIYIPESHNDFIFAKIISNNFFPLFIIIIICYILIINNYIDQLNKNNNTYSIISLMTLNILLFQIFYNIGMNLSLFPVIGIPLPFLSYGGSYLITTYFLIGLSINKTDHNYYNNHSYHNIHKVDKV